MFPELISVKLARNTTQSLYEKKITKNKLKISTQNIELFNNLEKNCKNPKLKKAIQNLLKNYQQFPQ